MPVSSVPERPWCRSTSSLVGECLAESCTGPYAKLSPMKGYGTSAKAMARRVHDRRLRTVTAMLDQEPRKKSKAGRVEAGPFRAAVRQAADRTSDWPKPRAAVALDLHFHTSRRQPPALWALPKNYLDLLGAGSASATDDEGSVLYNDDSQVKLLFVSCRHEWRPDGTAGGSIIVEARTRASALADTRLAAELASQHDDFEEDPEWSRDGEPELDNDYHLLPPGTARSSGLTTNPGSRPGSSERTTALFEASSCERVIGCSPAATRWSNRSANLEHDPAQPDLWHSIPPRSCSYRPTTPLATPFDR